MIEGNVDYGQPLTHHYGSPGGDSEGVMALKDMGDKIRVYSFMLGKKVEAPRKSLYPASESDFAAKTWQKLVRKRGDNR